MANKILSKKPDKSVAAAIRKAKQDGKIHRWDLMDIIVAAWDGKTVSHVEFRDIKRLLRTEPIPQYLKNHVEDWLDEAYPRKQPSVYPGNLDDLDGAPKKGNHQCAALVQYSQPIGKTSTWREGIRVKGNGARIKKGTAVATFEDGFYPNRKHGNHVAYYISQDSAGIQVMDQWPARDKVGSRTMRFKGKRANGLYVDPSNNGDALSVIMHMA